MVGDPVGGGPGGPDDQMPLAFLARASSVGFWDWDLVTNKVTLSSGWKRQIGYEPHEISDEFVEWESRLHSDDRPAVLGRLRAYLEHPDAPYEAEFRFRHKDGSYRWILTRGEVVSSPDGPPIRMVGCHIDVTERKYAEGLVLDSRHRYASLVRSIDGIVWEADVRTFRFTYVSEAARDILGYPPECWVDDPNFWVDHMHPDDRDHAVSFCKESTARGEPHQFEYRMITLDGRVVWLRDIVSVVVEDGEPTLLRGLMIDVTDRKAVEAQIEQDRSSLELSMELGQLGCWELDLETSVVTMDDQIFRMLRTTAAEQGGYQMPLTTYAQRFLPPQIRGNRNELLAALATDPNYTRQLEHPCIRADGTTGFISMRFTIVKDASGKTIRGRGVMQDITERKQTELRLTRLVRGESLLSSLSQRFIEMDLSQFDAGVESALKAFAEFGSLSRAALFVYSSDGQRVLNTHEWCANPADSVIAELRDMRVGTYAYFREELTAQRVVCVESLDDLPADCSERRYADERGYRSCLLFPLTSRSRLTGVLGFYGAIGEHRGFDADLKSLLSSFAASVANLISRKAAEDERLRLEKQLLQAQKMEAIGTLAGGIAHDFNNILGAIVGNLGLARIDAEQGRPVDDSLLEIERASERARDLVQQILAFSRQQEHERRVMGLTDIVQEATRLMRATIPATVSIEAALAGEVPDVVADPTQIHQILMNLCANAWHAMEGRSGAIVVQLEGTTVRPDVAARMGIDPGRYACLAVRDTGRGMDEETLKRVFDPFFTTKVVGQGTGLGMSVVHGIVRSHHGGISIDSKVAGGTTVRVYLPAASTGTASPEPVQPPPTTGRGERILLVDDEDAIVKVMSRILERLGYRVTACDSSLDAIQAFRGAPEAFDLVLSDYEMPDVTGLEMARVIYGLRPDTPVVLCSGRYRAGASVDPDSAANVRRLITKPCSASVLSRVVREVLDERTVT